MPYDPYTFKLYQNFDFALATDAQKEVFARETAYRNRYFPASLGPWKSQQAPSVRLDPPVSARVG